MIQDHVHARSPGDLTRPRGDVGLAVVGDEVGADVEGSLALGRSSGRGEHGCTVRLGELDCGRGDTAVRGVDHDHLPGCQAAAIEHRVMRSEPCRWERGRTVVGDVIRDHVHVRLRHEAQFRIATMRGGPQDAQLAVEVAAARMLRTRGHLRQRWIDHHTLADAHGADLRTDFGDDPGDVHAGDVGQREPVHQKPAVALHDIEVVQRRGAYANDDVARSGLGIVDVDVLQHLGSARTAVQQRLHRSAS